MKEKEKKIQRILQETIDKDLKLCWICGRKDIQLTKHHLIPQRIISAKVNITCWICPNCNHILHKNDELTALLRRIFFKGG